MMYDVIKKMMPDIIEISDIEYCSSYDSDVYDEPDKEHEVDNQEDEYEGHNGAEIVAVHFIMQITTILTICCMYVEDLTQLYISLVHFIAFMFSNLYLCSITHIENKFYADLSNLGSGVAIVFITILARIHRDGDSKLPLMSQINIIVFIALGVQICTAKKQPMRLLATIIVVLLMVVHTLEPLTCDILFLRLHTMFFITFFQNDLSSLILRQFSYTLLTASYFSLFLYYSKERGRLEVLTDCV